MMGDGWRQRVMAAALLSCLAVGVWQELGRNRFAAAALAPWLHGEVRLEDAAYLARLDQLYRELPPGNLYLAFRDLRPEERTTMVFVQAVRATYVRFPGRVYVAESGEPIEDVWEVVNRKLPSREWLAAHGVSVVVTFERVDGQPRMTVQRVEELP